MKKKFKNKAAYVYTLIMLFVLTQSFQNSYAQNEVAKSPSKIHLSPGKKNPSIPLGTLNIEPVNLVVAPECSNNDPYTQLELNINEEQTQYTVFLPYYNVDDDRQKHNYPLAFGDHTFSLVTDNSDVQLVIDKMEFDKAFTLKRKQKATVGKLSILFESSISTWDVDPQWRHLGDYNIYYLLLSDGDEQQEISFESLTQYEDNRFSVMWKNYKIGVLSDSEKLIGLKVTQESPARHSTNKSRK